MNNLYSDKIQFSKWMGRHISKRIKDLTDQKCLEYIIVKWKSLLQNTLYKIIVEKKKKGVYKYICKWKENVWKPLV